MDDFDGVDMFDMMQEERLWPTVDDGEAVDMEFDPEQEETLFVCEDCGTLLPVQDKNYGEDGIYCNECIKAHKVEVDDE